MFDSLAVIQQKPLGMSYNPHLKSEMWGTHFVPAQTWTTRLL